MKLDNFIWWLQLIALLLLTTVFAFNIKQYITCECFYTWVGIILGASLLYFLFQTFVVTKCVGYVQTEFFKWTKNT